MPKYQVIINEREYAVSADQLAALDQYTPSPGHYHVLQDGKSYHVEVLKLDLSAKEITLNVNGRPRTLKINDETDQLVKQLGFASVSTAANKNVMAPMPGLVLDIMVKEGESVSAGTPLLILEAMKMENVLKAEADGVIQAISVNKGDAVEKRQLLIELA
ncbi:MAG: biotin/lipoyl-containing protein [Bacteroidota bacterium]